MFSQVSQSTIRVFLLAALAWVGLRLWTEWQAVHPSRVQETKATVATAKVEPAHPMSSFPTSTLADAVTTGAIGVDEKALIHLENDVLRLSLDRASGDILAAELKRYPEKLGSERGVHLLDEREKHYSMQSGLIFKTQHTATPAVPVYHLTHDTPSSALSFEATAILQKGRRPVHLYKKISLKPGSYLVEIQQAVRNTEEVPLEVYAFGSLKRKAPEGGNGFFGIQTFTGMALSSEEKPYQKVNFSDVNETPIRQSVKGGWAAMIEHHFLSAWIGDSHEMQEYSARSLDKNKQWYGVDWIGAPQSVAPDATGTFNAALYLGPALADVLKTTAPNLELSIDYGIFWPICSPILWVLKHIQQWVGNWGIAVILTTVLVKALFFKLSASSFRSMAKMKTLQPKLESLKQRYGNDKQKFGMAMMELYKNERVSPLGGCLPMLAQVPVFIALYYVILNNIELRQAPFVGWIQDLSAKDPYYVLPLLMGASMILQQKMSPASPDPIQAKMMMLMPVLFTVMFLSFPSGLMLYWCVNNFLSILQQWIISRHLQRPAANAHGSATKRK